jgi:hypothetical protein
MTSAFTTMGKFAQTALALLVGTTATTSGSPTFSPFQPPSYPLAVRNPYVSSMHHCRRALCSSRASD